MTFVCGFSPSYGHRVDIKRGCCNNLGVMKSIFLGVCTFALVSVVVGGCSETLPAPAKAIMEAQLSKPTGSNCPLGGITFQSIGRFADSTTSTSKSTDPIQDGQIDGTAVVNVSCRVFPNGGLFNFKSVTTKQNSGTISMSGNVSSTGESKVQVTLSGGELLDRYSQDDCVFTPFHDAGEYDATVDGKATKLPDIAAGRIWGNVKCNQVVRTDQQPELTCATNIRFRLENCEQPAAN
jgi:hypothetical protein